MLLRKLSLNIGSSTFSSLGWGSVLSNVCALHPEGEEERLPCKYDSCGQLVASFAREMTLSFQLYSSLLNYKTYILGSPE